MADQLPGMNVFQVLATAPQDIIGLATRHMTETLSVMNMGMQKLSAELAVPPALPMGLPTLPGLEQLSLPPLPGMTPAAPAAQAAAKGYILTQRGAPKLLGV